MFDMMDKTTFTIEVIFYAYIMSTVGESYAF